MRYTNRTLEWDGWRFSIEARLIRARPAPGRPGIGMDLVFRFDDMRDDMICRHIRLIMHTINIGAHIRGASIRGHLGCDGKRLLNPADMVWNDSAPKYWVIYRGWETDLVHFDEHPDDLAEYTKTD